MQLGYMPLQGEQDGDYATGIYVVLEDIIIRQGKQMVIAAGCTLLVAPDRKIITEGQLICKGTADNRILFSLLPRNKQYAAAADSSVSDKKRWRGILITKIGSAALDNTVIRNTDSALVSLAPPEALKLECIDLPSDAACPVNILGNCPRIDSPTCFTLREGMMNPDSGTKTVSMQPGKPDLTGSQTGNRKVLWKNVGLWSSAGFGAVAVGTGIAAFVFDRQAQKHRDEENKATSERQTLDANEKYSNAMKRRNVANMSSISAGVLTIGMGVVYIFNF